MSIHTRNTPQIELRDGEHIPQLGFGVFQVPPEETAQAVMLALQAGLRRLHSELGITTEAWSPLAQGQVLDEPVIVEMAERFGKTPAQVIIRWHLQIGNVVIPKSVTPERIEQNIDAFDFGLTQEDLAAIAELDAGERIGPDPDPDTFARP